MATNDGYQLTNLGNGTYGAENPTSGQSVAFSDPQQAQNFLGTPTIDYSKAITPTLAYQQSLANPNQAIAADSLGTNTPINLPQVTPSASPLPGAIASGEQTAKTLDQYIKELTPAQTDTNVQYDSLLSSINTLLPGTAGRGQDQVTAEANAGIPELKKNLSDINSRILTKIAEAKQSDTSYEQLIANLENPNNTQQRGIPMSAIIGQQAQVRKAQLADHNAKAADIGLLQAYAQGLQGQVSSAQETVNRAIDLKYKDREDELNVKLKQLELLSGKLSKEEEIRKTALERQYKDQQQAIADEKAKAKDNITAALNAGIKTRYSNNKGEFFDTVTGQSFTSPQAFFKAAGVTSFAEAYAKGLVSDITESQFKKTGVASYDEWQLYKSQGGKLDYNSYQTMDANRKRAISNTTITYNQQQDQNFKGDLSQTNANLSSVAGSDGYVNVNDWKRAYNDWIAQGHPAKDFIDNFKGFVNPDSQDPYFGVTK